MQVVGELGGSRDLRLHLLEPGVGDAEVAPLGVGVEALRQPVAHPVVDGRARHAAIDALRTIQPGEELESAVLELLGPAFEMRGGDLTRIVRPHQVRFVPDPAGPFAVRHGR